MLGSGGPTHHDMETSIRISDIVAPTTIHEKSLDEADALRSILEIVGGSRR